MRTDPIAGPEIVGRCGVEKRVTLHAVGGHCKSRHLLQALVCGRTADEQNRQRVREAKRIAYARATADRTSACERKEREVTSEGEFGFVARGWSQGLRALCVCDVCASVFNACALSVAIEVPQCAKARLEQAQVTESERLQTLVKLRG